MANNIGVHVTHCCVLHGCKYGQLEKCPVCTGEHKQQYLCEDCSPIHSNRQPDDYESKQWVKITSKIRDIKLNKLTK
jgi:hypothetical protein